MKLALSYLAPICIGVVASTNLYAAPFFNAVAADKIQSAQIEANQMSH